MPISWDENTVRAAENLAFGAKGFDEITGTENGRWFVVKAVGADATFNAKSEQGDNLSSVVLQNGDVIFGKFSQIIVTDGLVLAYRL